MTCSFEYANLSFLVIVCISISALLLCIFFTKSSKYLSIFNLPIKVPPITVSISPTTTYAIAIFIPNTLERSIKEAKSTRGDDIKKENVIAIGIPAEVKPINKGIDEHEQNGVTVPNNAANIFADIPLNRLKIFFVHSGGK